MSLADFLETKNACGLRAVAASCRPVHNGLHGDFRKRKFPRAQHEAAKEAEMHSAWHLQQWIERAHGSKAAEESGQAKMSAPANHGEGIQQGAVANQLQHGVHAFRVKLADAARKVGRLQFDALRTE